jgi:D-alanine-D-alanine ligase-like ATP-grasp enzyme/acylphosphatase
MKEKQTEWLPHLTEAVVADAHGHLLDSYAVALEGWRRGLKLRWHVKDSEKFKDMYTWSVDNPGQLFSLSSSKKTHYFFRTRGDLVANEAVVIGKDKERTKEVLIEAGLQVPEGKRYSPSMMDEKIMIDADKMGYPVVIKPTDGSFGEGVVTNITSEGELEFSLEYVRNQLKFRDLIMEQYIPGEDYRLYVVEDKVVGAIKRIPANVVGDGKTPIKKLVEEKNERRSQNPRLASCPIQLNEEAGHMLGRKGYTVDTIPAKGERIFLSAKSNVSLGGDPIDVLDDLPEEAKQAAVDTIQAIPGLVHGAVDLIIHNEKPIEEAVYIIEVNPTAQLGGILFPLEGDSRDVPSAIIDYYFPETVDVRKNKANVFFDLHDVLDPLQSRDASVTTVTPCPQEKLYAKKYIVSGDVLHIGYHRGLRKQAFERYLHGYIMSLDNGDMEVVVAGTDPEMVDDFKHAFYEDEERGEVESIEESTYHEPVKVGFEIKADLKTQLEQLKEYERQFEVVELQMKQAELEKRKYENSLSWKATAPVRLAGAIVKRFK